MNRKVLYGVVVSFLVLAVAGCAYQGAAPMENPAARAVVVEKEVEVAPEAGERAFGTTNYASDEVSVERLIIRNASLDLVVPDTEEALAEINDVVDELDGYIVESNVYQSGESKSASVRLRVPAEKLDEALERFRGLATEVRSENISGQDVTQEYVDLQSYLRNREAVQARLLEYLEEAKTTEDALAVDTQLRQIEAEIEQTKGRIQYLEQSAAMSQVTLTLMPDELAQPIEIGGWNLGAAWRDAIEGLDAAFQFLVEDVLIRFGIPAGVILTVIAAPLVGLFFLIRALVRRRRARTAD